MKSRQICIVFLLFTGLVSTVSLRVCVLIDREERRLGWSHTRGSDFTAVQKAMQLVLHYRNINSLEARLLFHNNFLLL